MAERSDSHLVFVSYNAADKETATNIALFLAAENISVWYDEWKVSAGDSIIDEVESGLGKCSHFVIIWSKNSDRSNWVRLELKAALTRALKVKSPIIIPVILDDVPLPPLLQDIRYVKYHGGTEQDRKALVEAILGKKPTMAFIRAVVRKYREVVYSAEGKYPFAYNVCPECGSDKLKGSSVTDYAHDEVYFTLTCEDCRWNTWTQ